MHIVIYANPSTESYQRLHAALESMDLSRPPEIHDDATHFRDRFRSAVDCPDVVIIMPASVDELDALVGSRDLFEHVRTIVVLPSHEPDMLSKGHKFRPRFMASIDDDFGNLIAVLGKLERKVSEDQPSEALPPTSVAMPDSKCRSKTDRIASFIIDREKGTELAINAEHVLEATPINGAIQPLPSAVDFLEGFMHLRDEAIPVINLKKRLAFSPTGYDSDAKVAVVGVDGFRFGLLFDDIKDVLHVTDEMIRPVHPALLTDHALVTEVVQLENGRRMLQLLDLARLFGDLGRALGGEADGLSSRGGQTATNRVYKRFVIFSAGRQHYGMPVEHTQEITFLADIDRTFQSDLIEGSLDLRGHYIPVINAAHLLHQDIGDWQADADTRVLVMDSDTFQYGMIVDCISEIISIAEDDIMRLPGSQKGAVEGVFQHADGRSIMLITPARLIGDQHSELRSVARLKASGEETSDQDNTTISSTRHLITAECYLLFSIGRTFAIELNDVQEIIEDSDLLALPGNGGFDHRVLNLRGTVVPVIDLRHFYGYEPGVPQTSSKLIIARKDDRIVAFEVDQILTIYKQVQFQRTPSLNPRFSGKEDTLDRLIEYLNDEGIKEHVLVVNVGAMMENHLGLNPSDLTIMDQPILKETTHDIHAAQPS